MSFSLECQDHGQTSNSSSNYGQYEKETQVGIEEHPSVVAQTSEVAGNIFQLYEALCCENSNLKSGCFD
jgi:hypothetical protein